MPASSLRVIHQQNQALSPRLQHAVRLLQMSSLDFAQTLAETLGRNPFLEGDEGEDAPLPPGLTALVNPLAEPGSATAPREDLTAADQAASDYDAADEGQSEPPPDAGSWNEALPAGNKGDGPEVSATELVASSTGLNTHLHGQLNLLPLGPRDMALAKAVVELLDDDGYLRGDPFELTTDDSLDPPATDEEVRIAVRRVQSLDPAGVGARTVQECLLLQTGEIECSHQRALARRIIGEQLRLLGTRDCETLAHKLGFPLADVEAACARIRRFDPRPGWRFGAPPVHYVTPDVIARRYRGRWVAVLNPAVVPRLRLNSTVVDLFQRHRGAPCPDLASHLQEARWTVRNVEQRFSTIVAVAQAVIDRQHHFLDYGEMAMKPLGLKEIAEAVGVHESTVSRVTSNKYIATPAGVFELKHFFSRAMVMPSGASLSPTAIRGLVRDIIADEKASHPLSDTEITQLLWQQGLRVARRTVTKYRQALRIEPAARRKAAAAG